MHRSITLPAALTAFFATRVLAQGYEPLFWCRGFNQTGNYTRGYLNEEGVQDPYSHRISEAVICNSTNVITDGGDKNGTCAVEAGGFFESEFRTNVTDEYNFMWDGQTGEKSEEGDYLFNAASSVAYSIQNNTNAEHLTAPGFGGVMNTTYYIDEGTNAYVAFIPLYRCISGWLSNCTTELAELEKTYVEMCYPEYTGQIIDTRGGLAVYEGNTYIEEVNETVAANLTGNPNEQPPSGLQSSGAGMVKVGSLLGYFGGLIATFTLI